MAVDHLDGKTTGDELIDRTDDATTKIWGPWSEFHSQVWESDALTYNRCQITLEPSIIPEKERPTLKPGGVLIYREGWARKIETEVYEAKVAADGCMPSLRIDGVEVLRANIDASRGLPPPGKNPAIERCQTTGADDNRSDKNSLASIRYEFAHDKMTWTVETSRVNPCRSLWCSTHPLRQLAIARVNGANCRRPRIWAIRNGPRQPGSLAGRNSK